MSKTSMQSTEYQRSYPVEKLPPKKRKFVVAFVANHGRARDAAIKAGYAPSSASTAGARLLKDSLVQRAISGLEKEIWEKNGMEAWEVLAQLYYLCTRSVEDFLDEDGCIINNLNLLPTRARQAIDSIEQEYEYDKETGEKRIAKCKIRLVPKSKALELAMQHKGLFAAAQQDVRMIQLDFDAMVSPPEEEVDIIEAKIASVGK